MRRFNVEVVVGLFVIAGVAAFSYLAIMLGEVEVFDQGRYTLSARFSNASGLKDGAAVEMGGVVVGKVERIHFDPQEWEAVVDLSVPDGVRVPDDAIASIRSTGIIGSKFVKISSGGSEEYLGPGDEITETESSVSLEELISKYIFESK